jgi:3-keto-5-aminohexanoate cleavage enzyme
MGMNRGTAMDKLIIKVALNEWVMKEVNPHTPYSPEEIAVDIVRCAKAGASLFHFHARDPKTGAQRRADARLFAEAFRLAQAECDGIIVPGYEGPKPMEERFSHWIALAQDPSVRFEMGVFDVGQFNLTTYEELRTLSRSQLETFNNTHGEMKWCLDFAKRLDFRYTLGLREPGHLRSVLAYHEYGWTPAPLLLKFYMSEKHPYGLPPTARGLQMYIDMIPDSVPHLWFTEIKGPHVHVPLSSVAIAMGGHVRTGLGDNWVLNDRPVSNLELVETFANLAERCGRGVATPAEARRMMGVKPVAGARSAA